MWKNRTAKLDFELFDCTAVQFDMMEFLFGFWVEKNTL